MPPDGCNHGRVAAPDNRAGLDLTDGAPSSGDVEPVADDLRGRTMRGALWLLLREGGGICVRLVGVLLLTRLLGPGDFGVYAGALAVMTVVASVAQLSVEVFLVRRVEAGTPREIGTAYSLLLMGASTCILLVLAATFVAEPLGLSSEVIGILRLMLVGLLLNVLWAPAQAALEREFRYRALGMLELAGDVVLYAVAVPLAVAGLGPYAAAWGYVAWQALLLVGSCVLARCWPRLAWDRPTAQSMLRFGFAYSSVSVLPKLADLVNPLVVGAVAGSAGVGIVALAFRLVQTVGFFGRMAFRIALVVLARIGDDVPRLSRAFREGMALQVLGVGVPLVALCVSSRWLVPVAFGDQWTATVEVLPYLAAGAVLGETFGLHLHIITVRGRMRSLAQSYVLTFVLRLGGAVLLVPLLGLKGYGIAVILGLVGVLPLHYAVRAVIAPRYDQALPWLVAFVPLLFTPVVSGPAGWALWLPLVLVLSLSSVRAQLQRHLQEAKRTLRPTSSSG